MPFLSIDSRGLRVFRVCLGVLGLAEMSLRLPDVEAFYGPFGIVPRSFLQASYLGTWVWSLNFLFQSVSWAYLLLCIQALCSIGLMIGYRPNICAALCWALLSSRHVANPYVNTAGDELLRHLLLWTVLLNHSKAVGIQRSAATVGVSLQIAFVYLFSALAKSDPVWWRDGTALELALRLDTFLYPWSRSLLEFPMLCRTLSYGTWYLEFLGPPLFILSSRIGWIRMIVCSAFILFHLGLAATMRLGIFPFVCIAAWILLLPSSFFDRLFPVRGAEVASLFEGSRILRPLRSFAASCLILYSFALNWGEVVGFPNRPGAEFFRLPEMFQLWQRWAMFAPYPSIDDGWPLIRGKLEDGYEFNFLSRKGRPPAKMEELSAFTDQKPADISILYASPYWLKFLFSLHLPEHQGLQSGYFRFLCLKWNDLPGNKKLTELQFVYMLEMTEGVHSERTPSPIIFPTVRCGNYQP